MIDLAPGHKQGLVVANPVLIAGGVVGYGEIVPRGLSLAKAGAVVVGPVMGRSRTGANLPRLAETAGGMVIKSNLQSRGLNSVLAKFAKLWPRIECPVVVQVVESGARDVAQVVERLANVPGVAGLELASLAAELETVERTITAAVRISDLPIWVKLPLANAATWAPSLVSAGASALVVGQPPMGALGRGAAPGRLHGVGALVQGAIYGPLAFAPMLERLVALAELKLPCALIACGGIHSVEQARQALEAGALAIQIDTALWVEPALLGWICDALAEKAKRGQAGGKAGGH
jgi:dihydroorotate dehydrogenase (NAD+) catalytic subunit